MTDTFMLKLPSAVTAITSILLTIATGALAQTIPPNIPAAIMCSDKQVNADAVSVSPNRGLYGKSLDKRK
jgi:hypothetical protein